MKNKAQMVFYGVTILLLLAVVLTAFFCGGFKGVFAFYGIYFSKKVEINTKNNSGIVYIDGAVSFAGFYSFDEKNTLKSVLNRAGLIDGISYTLNLDLEDNIDIDTKFLVVNFALDGQNGDIGYPINVNASNTIFEASAKQIGIADSVIEKIISFVLLNGKIRSKGFLKQLLTVEEWTASFFKLYVGA